MRWQDDSLDAADITKIDSTGWAVIYLGVGGLAKSELVIMNYLTFEIGLEVSPYF